MARKSGFTPFRTEIFLKTRPDSAPLRLRSESVTSLHHRALRGLLSVPISGCMGIPRKLGTVSGRLSDRGGMKKTQLTSTGPLLLEIQDIFEKPRVGVF